MRRTIKLLVLAAILTVFAVPVWAQSKECNDEFKSATYSKWYDNRLPPHQDVAFQAAEEYLTTCPNDESPYKTAIKKFYDAYKLETEKVTNRKQFEEAFQKKNYADQIRLGKVILATEPDNAAVNIIMGVAGLGDPNLINESAQYAKKAIELIQAGKPFAPYAAKDQALAALNYVIAQASLKSAPADAIPYLLKAARLESDLKKNPQLYLDLAGAYNDGPRAKLTADYQKFVGQPETPESKLVLANLNQVIDRQIDALARAAALTTDAANKKLVMDELTDLYEYRNKSKTGLNELVANVLSKPLPDVPTPLTSLPPPPTPTTPATGSQPPGSTGATTAAATGNAKVGNTGTGAATGTGTGTQTGKANGTAKPAATPTPAKKPRRTNHRRG